MDFSKKPLIATAVVFVILAIASSTIHSGLVAADYAKMTGVFRPPTQINIPTLMIAYLLTAIGFVQIYLKGRESLPFLSQGIRFGLLTSLFAIVPWYLIYFAVIPYQFDVTLKLIVFETIRLILAGIAAAFVLKD